MEPKATLISETGAIMFPSQEAFDQALNFLYIPDFGVDERNVVIVDPMKAVVVPGCMRAWPKGVKGVEDFGDIDPVWRAAAIAYYVAKVSNLDFETVCKTALEPLNASSLVMRTRISAPQIIVAVCRLIASIDLDESLPFNARSKWVVPIMGPRAKEMSTTALGEKLVEALGFASSPLIVNDPADLLDTRHWMVASGVAPVDCAKGEAFVRANLRMPAMVFEYLTVDLIVLANRLARFLKVPLWVGGFKPADGEIKDAFECVIDKKGLLAHECMYADDHRLAYNLATFVLQDWGTLIRWNSSGRGIDGSPAFINDYPGGLDSFLKLPEFALDDLPMLARRYLGEHWDEETWKAALLGNRQFEQNALQAELDDGSPSCDGKAKAVTEADPAEASDGGEADDDGENPLRLKGMWVTVKAEGQKDGNRVYPESLWFKIGNEKHDAMFDEAADQYDTDDGEDLCDYYVDGPNYGDSDGVDTLEKRVREVTLLYDIAATFEDDYKPDVEFVVEGLRLEFYVNDEPAAEDLAETPVFTVEVEYEAYHKLLVFTAKPEALKGLELNMA